MPGHFNSVLTLTAVSSRRWPLRTFSHLFQMLSRPRFCCPIGWPSRAWQENTCAGSCPSPSSRSHPWTLPRWFQRLHLISWEVGGGYYSRLRISPASLSGLHSCAATLSHIVPPTWSLGGCTTQNISTRPLDIFTIYFTPGWSGNWDAMASSLCFWAAGVSLKVRRPWYIRASLFFPPLLHGLFFPQGEKEGNGGFSSTPIVSLQSEGRDMPNQHLQSLSPFDTRLPQSY